MHQIIIEGLASKNGQLSYSKPLSDGELLGMVKNEVSNLDKMQNNVKKAREWVTDKFRLPQRRIHVSPTLTKVFPMVLERSNLILRLQKKNLEYFVRVNILDEYFELPWFNDSKS